MPAARASSRLSLWLGLLLSAFVAIGCGNDSPTTSSPGTGGDASSEFGTVRFFDEDVDDTMVSVSWPTFDDFGDLADFSDIAFVGSIEGVVNDFAVDEGSEEDLSGVSVVFDGIVFSVERLVFASEDMNAIGDRITISHPVVMQGPQVGFSEEGLPLQEILIFQEPVERLRQGLDAIDEAERPTYLIFAKLGVYGDQEVVLLSGAAGIQQVVEDRIVANGISPFTASGWIEKYDSELTVDFVEAWLNEGESAEVSDEFVGVVDGPVVSVPGPLSNVVQEALIEGVLSREGDCLYVTDVESGSQFALLWLFGTRWDEEAQEVVGLNGDRARVGETLSAGGGYGTPEQYERLLVGDGLTERAVECVVGEFREMAYVQDRFSSE